MVNTLESLTEPLIRIRLELLYTELLECHVEYNQLLLMQINTLKHFVMLCPINFNIPFFFTKTLKFLFNPS